MEFNYRKAKEGELMDTVSSNVLGGYTDLSVFCYKEGLSLVTWVWELHRWKLREKWDCDVYKWCLECVGFNILEIS